MSDRLNTTTKKSQNLDSTFNVNPFQARGFGLQQKAAESTPATKAELWENYQQAKQLSQKGVNVSAPGLPIQAKLTIGQPGDKYEQEADSMAAQVMQMPESGLANSNITNSVQTRSIQPIQRACTECHEEKKEESKSEEDGDQIQAKEEYGQTPELTSIQRKVNSAEDPESGSNLESQLNGSKGGGSPLTDEVRGFMEPRFGADFGDVRVHTGSDAVQMNGALNAQAFAHGSDIYFGAGKSPGNNELTAHELTHVVQQTGQVQSAPGGSPDASAPANSSTNFTPNNTTREVHGATLSQVYDSMTNSGSREAASVLPVLKPAPQYEYDKKDKVTKVAVTVVENKEMPSWAELGQQCPPIKNEWNRFYGVLDKHEDKHVEIDRKHYTDVHKKLVGKSQEAAWKKMDDVIEAADLENQAYDTSTRHGLNEGTIINGAVQCGIEKVSTEPGDSGVTSDTAIPESTEPEMMAKLERFISISQPQTLTDRNSQIRRKVDVKPLVANGFRELRVQRDGPTAAPPSGSPSTPASIPANQPAIEPQNRNKKIATWTGWVDNSVKTTVMVGEAAIQKFVTPVGAIPASITPQGWTPGHYASEAQAIAAIRAAGNAGAVFPENGQFVAYHASGETMLHSFTLDNLRWFSDKPWTALRFDSNATVIITEDGAALRPEHYKTKDEAKTTMADQALMPGDKDPFAGYQGAFDLTKPGVLELVFYPAMKDYALSQISSSRKQVERDIERRFSSGIISQDEIKKMRSTAEYLAGIDEEIGSIPKELPTSMDENENARIYENNQRFKALEQRRRVVLARYPVLARVTPREFIKLPEDQQMAQLGNEDLKIRDDIDKTRNNIIDGSLNLWKIRPLVDATTVGLGINSPQLRKQVTDLAAANQSSVSDDVLKLFTVVLGLAAVVTTGPLAVVVAAGAFGLGVADAIKETDEYLAESSAANTALDPKKSLLPPEDVKSWGWLVVAWVGVVADAAQVVTAIKAIKAAEGTIEAGVKILAKGDQKLASELRLAAGAGDVTEIISDTNKLGLANRLGTSIEIDATLGKEIRVYYTVDREGRIAVDGIRCGKEARVGEILAHGPVVKMLKRYDGLMGKLRQLLDKMRSLASFPSPGVNPFPPGSQAFESFFEINKLPDILASRRTQWAASLGTESESILRREVDFLESEIARHQTMVDQMVLEKGVGYIAAAGEDTKNAIKQFKMPDIFNDPLIKDPSKYYYQVNPGGNPPYWLKRFANADVDPLTLVVDGSGGWKIAKGALSRGEEAVAMVKGWPEKIREGYEAVENAFKSGVYKVVPLQGVATTGKKFSQIMTSQQQRELYNILEKAFKVAKDPDPAARATSVVTALMEHDITAVKGTDQLRAFNYRLSFAKTSGAEASGDLHHAIPLYLGGDNVHLVDMEPGLHDALHELIEGIKLEEGVSLAPSSVQAAKSLNFTEGAAVLFEDARVQLIRLNPDGSYVLVP